MVHKRLDIPKWILINKLQLNCSCITELKGQGIQNRMSQKAITGQQRVNEIACFVNNSQQCFHYVCIQLCTDHKIKCFKGFQWKHTCKNLGYPRGDIKVFELKASWVFHKYAGFVFHFSQSWVAKNSLVIWKPQYFCLFFKKWALKWH